jgi:hypothetical protein
MFSPVTGAILMSQFPFTEIAVKSLLISALCSVSHLVLTLLTGMWVLRALLLSLLSMWASTSPGLPGESQQLQAFLYGYDGKIICVLL